MFLRMFGHNYTDKTLFLFRMSIINLVTRVTFRLFPSVSDLNLTFKGSRFQLTEEYGNETEEVF